MKQKQYCNKFNKDVLKMVHVKKKKKKTPLKKGKRAWGQGKVQGF